MVFDRMSLKSKTAVVTGAAHGLEKPARWRWQRQELM